MEEKKLTDEEIVKALECCAVEPCEDCGNCPRFTKEKLCHKANAKQSLDLIHRQNAKIERLTEENKRFWDRYHRGYKVGYEYGKQDTLTSDRKEDCTVQSETTECDNLRAENEELQKQVDELKVKSKEVYDLVKEKVKDTANYYCNSVIEKLLEFQRDGILGNDTVCLLKDMVRKVANKCVEV